MYCDKCGKYMGEGNKYCTNCNSFKSNRNGFKKFVFIVLGLFILINVIIFGISYFYLKNEYEENYQKSLTKVPYANQDIEVGTMITSNMISYENYMRKDMPVGDYYLSSVEIVGKCTNSNVVIDSGSIFYKDMLIDCDELSEDIFDENE